MTEHSQAERSQPPQTIQARLAELQADSERAANVLAPQGFQTQAAEARAKAHLCQQILGWIEAGVPLTLADIKKHPAFTEAEKQAEPRIYAHPEDYERREDGKVVRKDRWEWGLRNIVTALHGPRYSFEIDEVVESVRALAERAKDPAEEAGAVISAYALDLSPRSSIKVERVLKREGPATWAVRLDGDCLNRQGEWEWEPMPSGRDEDFLARCRFDTAEEAIAAAAQAMATMAEEANDAPRTATAPEQPR